MFQTQEFVTLWTSIDGMTTTYKTTRKINNSDKTMFVFSQHIQILFQP